MCGLNKQYSAEGYVACKLSKLNTHNFRTDLKYANLMQIIDEYGQQTQQ